MPKRNSKVVRAGEKPASSNDEVVAFINFKISNFKEIINKTIVIVQRYKLLDVIGASEINVCMSGLESLHNSLEILGAAVHSSDLEHNTKLVSRLQALNTELSGILRNFGTESVEDMIMVCFGQEFVSSLVTVENRHKYELIKNYVHPIGYKTVAWRDNVTPIVSSESKIAKNRIIEDVTIAEQSCSFDCFDLARSSRSFQTKVYGIKFGVHNHELRKTMIVCGVVDDVLVSCLNNPYIKAKLPAVRDGHPDDTDFAGPSFDRFVDCLTLKDLLVFTPSEIHNKFVGYMNQVQLIKQKPINQIVREFANNELFMQRLTLIQLLLKGDEPEFQYLAYLLYDLLSNDTNNNIDTVEQTLLYDSLPWNIKRYFRDAMKQTIQYTNNLCNFDNSKIPLEQQICLMKATDIVKEKAMVKLKEVKAKSEDSGSKARQYLEGLLRIPFNSYREEEVLNILPSIVQMFSQTMKQVYQIHQNSSIPLQETYTVQEVLSHSCTLKDEVESSLRAHQMDSLRKLLLTERRSDLADLITGINQIAKANRLGIGKLRHSGRRQEDMVASVMTFVESVERGSKTWSDVQQLFAREEICEMNDCVARILASVEEIEHQKGVLSDYTSAANAVLDTAVHGHEKAKRQVERIIGQWISGEQTGYCFGFEGPPGVGKTSLAKAGLANCLKDADGVSRPFAFIAVGGASNASTLDGHNYTYVGSTWGKIVDILMEKKCMNPIIFIDELDKVSRTEHGKEIIGILTHLIDSTQNDSFQDKYFTGIDLDLSRALFIFSYNDVEAIDSVLLDRIHRIKFEHLTLEDKLVICRKFLLPELYKKTGLTGCIELDDGTLSYIINTYTCEPGVRKLKEVLFEIVAEINLERLQSMHDVCAGVISVTKEQIKGKYLKNRQQIKEKKIHDASCVGTINGLWANAQGRGGIIPIETSFFPAGNNLELKLTGMQGDVMKESMNVAKTLAWTLTPESLRQKLTKNFSKNHTGIHIHCPEGAVPKDGPSAGGAITVALYSLLNGIEVRNDVAMTGEITLQGKITAIGGLDLKIVGGIRAGVTTFVYPSENDREFNEFMDKYKGNELLSGVTFHPVSTIHDVFKIVLKAE
jgi:ATP-dependent Lon protease